MKLSVVIAVYNEELNVKPLTEQITNALEGYDYEIIFVDDGSSDNTIPNLKAIDNSALKIIEFRKNYGQSSALMAGIDYAIGDYIITLDGDLQNDPSDIPMMLKMAEEGDWDLVAGIRKKRQDGMLLRKIPSKIANWIIRQASGVRMKDYGCALKVFKSEIAKDLGLYGELHRFMPVLAVLEGAKMTQVDVKHHARQFGVSKYGLGRTFKVISDLLLMVFFKKYMQKPMHLFGTWGVGLFSIGVLINLYLGFLKLQGQDIWGKPLLILGLMLVLGGIQLITVGIIVEIMMRTYFESQQKRPYKVRNVFDKTQSEKIGY
ncbi:MAG: glycosyltransferase family 2 protein [Bacteroidetes bacterium]|jgi:glycosyltransferase involved in cell wall biosynthesis|nr:glycosyltransferase family 2 protein [Bacteroidota bacterium]MDF1863943.1 glycosyltransferase family 2 protein [Saprospiraceae bacterium]